MERLGWFFTKGGERRTKQSSKIIREHPNDKDRGVWTTKSKRRTPILKNRRGPQGALIAGAVTPKSTGQPIEEKDGQTFP